MGHLTWDYANTLEVTIDRPATAVWPFFFGKKKDQWTRSDYTTVAGEPGKAGEVFMHEYTVLGERSFFFYEAIKVIPERELVLKITYKKKAEDKTELIGYDLLALKETAGRTTVELQQLVAFPTTVSRTDLNLETEKHDQFLADILQGLKKLVETGQ